MKSKGKITGRVLVLDFDDVILHSERLIDDAISKYWYTASDRYARNLNQQFQDNIIKTRDELNAEMEVYYDKKNQILEEVYSHLKQKIDYRKIINEQNISFKTIRYVRELINSNRYDMVIIESHFNSELEKDCKKELIEKLFPGAFFLPVRFFEQDYLESKEKNITRVRTSKAEYLKAYLDLNSIEYNFGFFTLIDNSPSNIKDWIEHGGIGLVFGNSNYPNAIPSLNPSIVYNAEKQFVLNSQNSIVKRGR